MKLKEISFKAIALIKEAGDNGLLNVELGRSLNVPRRRVYDLIAILNASGLVKVKRESSSTRIIWQGKEMDTERKLTKLIEINQKQKDEIQELALKLNQYGQHIKELERQPIVEGTRISLERTRLQHPIVRIIAESPGRILSCHNDALGMVIETSSPTILVEPVVKKVNPPWESEQVVFTSSK